MTPLLLLGVCTSTAWAGTAEAVAYNDALVNVTWVTGRGLTDLGAQAWLLEDAEAQAAITAQAHHLLLDAVGRVDALPTLPGDPGLKVAVRAGLLEVDGLMTEDLPALVAIVRKTPPADADLALAEERWRAFEDRGAAADRAVQEAQVRFARTFRLVLADAAPPPGPDRARLFRAPEIVPEGSRLPHNLHAAFAVGYRNHGTNLQNRVVLAYNRLAEASPDLARFAAERSRLHDELVLIRDAARAWGPWQGDATLRDGMVRATEGALAAVDGDLATYIDLAGRTHLSRAQADAANAALDRANTAIVAALDALSADLAAFDTRWKVAEFQAWARAEGALPAGD